MRIARSIAVLVVIVLLLSSCSSIYVADPEVTLQMSMEVDPDEEHFTLGNHHSKKTNDGVIYKDSFIYVEYQAYQEPITLPNGVLYQAYASIPLAVTLLIPAVRCS